MSANASQPRTPPPPDPAAPSRRSRGRLRRLVRAALWGTLALAIVVAIGLLFWFRGALYHRFIRFPREAAALAAIRADRQPVTESTGWHEYRGILHSHSELSHDCEVPFPQILEALKATGSDFICLSDHCTDGRADFSAQWRGLHEGRLFIPGFEMKEGLMPFGLPAEVVLSNTTAPATLARQIADRGGVLFFAHPEEPRQWELPELTGMEIYNTHADLKDERGGLLGLVPDLIVNLRRYPDQVFRLIFDRPVANLQRWDELNRTRRLTGIAGNDCHQNTGLRGWITEHGTLRIEDTSPHTLAEYRLNWLTRPLARLCFGPLTPGRRLFHLELDPYARMGRFVGTHVLAAGLSEAAILDALRTGRAFVGFDHLADSAGFGWWATNRQGRAVMGERLPFEAGTTLHAAAPHECRFTVVKDGAAVHRQVGRAMNFTPDAPGKYRVEAELDLRGEWLPWVYANPIELRAPAAAGGS